jgi:hypothetical protein
MTAKETISKLTFQLEEQVALKQPLQSSSFKAASVAPITNFVSTPPILIPQSNLRYHVKIPNPEYSSTRYVNSLPQIFASYSMKSRITVVFNLDELLNTFSIC